jgi:hypothetical protein
LALSPKILDQTKGEESFSPQTEPTRKHILSDAHPLVFHVFKFFASVRLAIPILITLMAVLGTGTFIESYYGAETAKILIYQSRWFGLVLLILGINVAAAAIDRIPWEKKHVGFVITHIGIILILIGSFMTSKQMIDGQMAIGEGETDFRITVSDPLLYIYSEKDDSYWTLGLKNHPFPWEGKELIAPPTGSIPFTIYRTADYPKARFEEKIMEALSGSAAIQVKLDSAFVHETQWLVQKDPLRGEIQLGPAKLSFTDQLLKENQDEAPARGYLEFKFEKSTVAIPLKEDLKLPVSFPIEGTPFELKVLRLLRNAVVKNMKLIDEPDPKGAPATGVNPAAELVLMGPNGFEEKHTVFAKFPDFPTAHGMKPSATGARILYRLPGGGSKGESHELRFVQNAEGLFYQIQDGLNVKTGKVNLGEEISLGWMDMNFKVEKYFKHAQVEKKAIREHNASESEDVSPAIRVEVQHSKGAESLWLRQNYREVIEIEGNKYHLVFGEKRIPAGFKLTLKDFRMENYPGTDRPASYESDVTLKDDVRGVVKDATVSMNEPLIYNGFRIYQSAFLQPEGEPEVSIFTVGKDPGIPLKYAGAIVMVLGTITMFFTRKFSTRGGKL